MVILPPGLHRIEADQYHADALRDVPTLSSSLARVILAQSPRHAWTQHPRLNPDHEPVEKKTFDIGRAAHRAVLGAGGDYVAYPDDMLASNGAASTKAAKEWAEAQRAAGNTPLKADEVDQIGEIADAVRAKLALMGIAFDPAQSEITALGEVDGVWCRAMIDNAPADARQPLYDLKTTMDASPDAVARAVMNYGYDVQAAHYLDVWKAATGEDRRFRFVFVEKTAPYEVAVVELYDHDRAVRLKRAASDDPASVAADWWTMARADAKDARRIWGECLASDTWPGYPAKVAVIGAPAWHNAQREARHESRKAAPKPSAEAIRAAAQFQAPEGM